MPELAERVRPSIFSVSRVPGSALLALLALSALAGVGCQGTAGPSTSPADGSPAAETEQVAAAETPMAEADDCAGGVVLDDGSVETGYGFVPSSSWGVFVQEFDSAAFASREISRVCVCWLRTREVEEVDYEVVFYEQQGNGPAAEPYASVQGKATDVPMGVANAGRLYPVEIDGVTLPEGKSYIGVRFDPSIARFFFVCTDRSEGTPIVTGFQKDDRSRRWTNVLFTPDPSFQNHRSVLIRAEAGPADASADSGKP